MRWASWRWNRGWSTQKDFEAICRNSGFVRSKSLNSTVTFWPVTPTQPCMTPWAPAAARSAKRFLRASPPFGSGGSLATTVNRDEKRRSLPMISGIARLKFPSSGPGVPRTNSGMAMPNFLVPLWVTLRKTSTPCDHDGGVVTGAGARSSPRTIAVAMAKPMTAFTLLPLLGPELEPEMDLEGGRPELGRQRRERAGLHDGAQRRLVVDRVAGAPLDRRLLDLPVAPDLEDDHRPLPPRRRAARRRPPLADLRLELPEVV